MLKVFYLLIHYTDSKKLGITDVGKSPSPLLVNKIPLFDYCYPRSPSIALFVNSPRSIHSPNSRTELTPSISRVSYFSIIQICFLIGIEIVRCSSPATNAGKIRFEV